MKYRRMLFHYDTQYHGRKACYRGWKGTWNKVLIVVIENWRSLRKEGYTRRKSLVYTVRLAVMEFHSSRI